jgi:hypothetical protein
MEFARPIPGIQTAAINLESGRLIIVMRIPKSWSPPHQVTLQKAFRFYSRDTNGKYQLDVDELRTIFIESEQITEKLRQFRTNRLSKIIADDVPAILPSNSRMIIHLLPLAAFATLVTVDLRELPNDLRNFVGLIGGFHNSRFNIDGLLRGTRHRTPKYLEMAA